MQTKCNGIDNDNDIKLLSTYNKKLQNTSEVETLESDEMAISNNGIMGRKKVYVSVKKVI